MADGVLHEQSVVDNTHAGLSGSAYYFDVADNIAPTAPGFSPAHASTGQSKSSAIVLTFNEVIQVCMLA